MQIFRNTVRTNLTTSINGYLTKNVESDGFLCTSFNKQNTPFCNGFACFRQVCADLQWAFQFQGG